MLSGVVETTQMRQWACSPSPYIISRASFSTSLTELSGDTDGSTVRAFLGKSSGVKGNLVFKPGGLPVNSVSESAVSLVLAGLGLAAAELTSSAALCVTHESVGPVRVPFPGSVRAAWLTASTRSFIFMA